MRLTSKFSVIFACLAILNSPNSNASWPEVACPSAQEKIANNSLEEAKKGMDYAIRQLKASDATTMKKYKLWFGVGSSSNLQEVLGVLQSSRGKSNSVSIMCMNSSPKELGDVYAYVSTNVASYTIVVTEHFFRSMDFGFNSKMGILIHELSHFYLTGKTGHADGKYGLDSVSASKALAKADPVGARKNADAYEHFIEDLVFM